MKHTQFIAAIVAVAGLAGATAALAQSGPGHHGPKVSFEELDADGNGAVSPGEMTAHRAARFAQVDANGDGKLSVEEMQAEGARRAAQRAARMMERFDSDGDGALSQDELPDHSKRGDMFSRMDKDGNGAVSKEEFDQARMNRGGMHHGGKGGKNCGQKQGMGQN